jgi:hypothetical protein
VEAAQVQLVNGRADGFKALWSHGDDVTLSGGLGGAIAKGWPQSASGSIGSQRSMSTAAERIKKSLGTLPRTSPTSYCGKRFGSGVRRTGSR